MQIKLVFTYERGSLCNSEVEYCIDINKRLSNLINASASWL